MWTLRLCMCMFTILCRMLYFMFYALGTSYYYLKFELYVSCLWTIICNILWIELCLLNLMFMFSKSYVSISLNYLVNGWSRSD